MSNKFRSADVGLLNVVDCVTEEVANAKAVLCEAMEYFDFEDELSQKFLLYRADNVHRLLIVVNHLLYDVINDLNKACQQGTADTDTAQAVSVPSSAAGEEGQGAGCCRDHC